MQIFTLFIYGAIATSLFIYWENVTSTLLESQLIKAKICLGLRIGVENLRDVSENLAMLFFLQQKQCQIILSQDPIDLSFSKICDLSNIKCLSIGSSDISVGKRTAKLYFTWSHSLHFSKTCDLNNIQF